MTKTMLLVLAMVMTAMPSLVGATDPKINPAINSEIRAQKLGMSLRCVVCKGESVQESPSKIAADMRALIRVKIQEGKSDKQILEWLEQRYGEAIYLKPPLTTRSYALWFLPLVFLLAGGLFAMRHFKK